MNDKRRVWDDDTGPQGRSPNTFQTPYFGRPNWLSARAQWLWDSAQPLVGTPAQRYLQAQAIDVWPAELRYLSNCPVDGGVESTNHPAMIAALRNEEGLVAVEQTFLCLNGGLADIERPRRLLGVPVGGLGRWGMVPQQILRLADSVEEAASAMVVGSQGIPVWPVFGAARYRLIDIPDSIKHIIIYATTAPEVTEAIIHAAEHLKFGGRSLMVEYPPDAKSWNAYLRRVRSWS